MPIISRIKQYKHKIDIVNQTPLGHNATRLISIIGPLTTLPQVVNVVLLNQIEGVSILTWGGYTLMAFFWLYIAFKSKDKVLIWENMTYVLMCSVICLKVLLI